MRGDLLGVMAVDPGVSTGVAWGVFPTSSRLSALARARLARKFANGFEVPHEVMGCSEINGEFVGQAKLLVDRYCRFKASFGVSMPVVLVVEDFVLRVQCASSDRAQLMPVRINAAVETLSTLAGIRVEYQMPGAAKAYATDERLRRWGFWERGSRHTRDAWRHVLLKVAESTC